jgi:protein-S-isoprenylcysteine O-methyltransferase Ste14
MTSAQSEFAAVRYRPYYRMRGVLMAPLFLTMVLCFWNECEIHAIQFSLGPLFFTAGLALRIWSQMHLGYRLAVRKVLTTTGPYTFTRNPIYIANMLILMGICVLSELLWFLPILLVTCAVIYSMVVRYEEAHLLQKYGLAYASYLNRVPRWVPHLLYERSPETAPVRRFFWPSVRVELYNLLWFAIPVAKEIISELT